MDENLKEIIIQKAIEEGKDSDGDIVQHNGHKYFVHIFDGEVKEIG